MGLALKAVCLAFLPMELGILVVPARRTITLIITFVKSVFLLVKNALLSQIANLA